MDRGVCLATVHRVAKSQTRLKQNLACMQVFTESLLCSENYMRGHEKCKKQKKQRIIPVSLEFIAWLLSIIEKL